MKTICIIDDHRPLWAEIDRFLADVNAQTYFIDEDSASEVTSGETPDLIIMGSPTYTRISSTLPPVKTLVLDDRSSSNGFLGKLDRNNVTVAGWPMDGSSLLSLTSDLLSVAERRFFKALIRIYPDRNQKDFHMGESEDFSLTGMSIMAAEDFSVGQRVDISFFVPKARMHLRVGAEIMRCFPHQAKSVNVYGCRFVDLDAAANDIIADFVLAPAR